jgi:hypothetical protein
MKIYSNNLYNNNKKLLTHWRKNSKTLDNTILIAFMLLCLSFKTQFNSCTGGSIDEIETSYSDIESYRLENFPKNKIALHFPCNESNMFATNCACWNIICKQPLIRDWEMWFRFSFYRYYYGIRIIFDICYI